MFTTSLGAHEEMVHKEMANKDGQKRNSGLRSRLRSRLRSGIKLGISILKEFRYVGQVFLTCLAIILLLIWFCDYMALRPTIVTFQEELEHTRKQVQYLQDKLDHAEMIEVETDSFGFLREVK